MDAEQAEQDRQWQRIAARWRSGEQKLRAPRDVVKRALRASDSRQGSTALAQRVAAPLMGAAVLFLAYSFLFIPERTDPVPARVAPVPAVYPSPADPWIPAEPCAETSSCVDVYAELALLDLPYSRGS